MLRTDRLYVKHGLWDVAQNRRDVLMLVFRTMPKTESLPTKGA